MRPFTSTDVILDQRYPRKKKRKTDGATVYPVKLRVSIDNQTRWYGLKQYMSKDEFKSVMSLKARGEKKDIRDNLLKEEKRARELLDAMKQPNWETFRNLYLQKAHSNGKGNVERYFDIYIEQCKKEGREGTASSYTDTKKSISKMMGLDGLNFRGITVSWLKQYQNKMEKAGKSPSTIGVYLRSLRARYNQAINDGVVDRKHYPFGKQKDGKFQIPSTRGNKRPLSREAIKKLANFEGDPSLMKYRDFFLLSYYMGGMNFADMLTLRWKQIKDDVLVYERKKTIRTKMNAEPLKVPIKGKIKDLIQKHGSPDNEYVFDLVKPEDSPETVRRKIQIFTKACNMNLKRLARLDEIKLPEEISTIWARHSAASHGVKAGAPLAVISQSLGHTNLATTSRYVSALTEDVDSYLDYLQSDD